MIVPLNNVWPKLVIVEGIMGSGKSTTTLNIAHRLEASGIPAIGITEGVDPLLEADLDMIAAHCREIVAVIKPLRPLLIYFHQSDVESANRLVSMQRGEEWVNYQVNWKLGSPYARRRGLAGLDGLIALYRQYRVLTDQLFADLDIPKVSIENSRQEWALYDGIIDRALMDVSTISSLPLMRQS